MKLLRSIINSLITTPETIGRKGEQQTASKLGWVNFCGKRGKLLQNVYVPRSNGETTEIDLLYVTQKGIFVIESKNYSGFVFGSENDRNWTSTLYAGKDWLGRKRVEKHQFYNPIWQNNTHMNELERYLGIDIEMISLIVFSDRCELKSISIFSSGIFVCKQSLLPRTVREIWKEYPDILDEEQINEIYEFLLPLTNQDEAVKEKHIADIQSRLYQTETCPWCGSTLVLRTARQGTSIGSQFWGCSNYPKCKYTKAL